MQRISVCVTSGAGGCFSSHLHALLKEARDVYHHPLLNDISGLIVYISFFVQLLHVAN